MKQKTLDELRQMQKHYQRILPQANLEGKTIVEDYLAVLAMRIARLEGGEPNTLQT